jgi:hypothetical protein
MDFVEFLKINYMYNLNLNKMKKIFVILIILMSLFVLNVHAQSIGTSKKMYKPTSIGIVIYSKDLETIWNAMRFANYSKSQGDTVSVFLLGEGVELDNMGKSNIYVKSEMDSFLRYSGTIIGCGLSLQIHKNFEPHLCKSASMKDLYDLVRKNKIVMTF